MRRRQQGDRDREPIEAGASLDEIKNAAEDRRRKLEASSLRDSMESAELLRQRADEARRSGSLEEQRMTDETARRAEAMVQQSLERFPELADEGLLKELAPTKWVRFWTWISARRSS